MREWEIWTPERAKHYRKNYGTPQKPQKRHATRMKLAASLVEGDSILDVGCGLGHLYPFIKPRTYLGVDNSPGMLAEARRLQPEATFQTGDIYDLSPLGTHDTVVCQSLLIHLPDTEKPIQQMWKHARLTLVFSTPIGPQETVRTAKTFGDRKLLLHTRTLSQIEALIKKLPHAVLTSATQEPNTPIGNTYIKTRRKTDDT